MVPQQLPKGDSASNVAGIDVHQIKCKTRTLVSAARSLHGIVIPRDHVCLPWAIKYAGQIICRSHKGTDGRTAWSRCFGRKKLPTRYAGWGEKVLYLPAGKAKAQLSKWLEGIYVCLKDESEEAIVGTPDGCEVVRSVRRLSREDASAAVLFNSIKGSPRV